MTSLRLLAAIAILTLLGLSGSAHALIVGGSGSSTNSQYLTAPIDDPGWDNVGWDGTGTTAGSAPTMVYIGEGSGGTYWALGVAHSGGGGITLGTDDPSGGTRYNTIATHTLTNPNDGDSLSDLRLYQLNGDPGLAALAISDASPTNGTDTVMIGTGVVRDSAETTFNVGPGQSLTGYEWGDTRDKAWGTSGVSATGLFAEINGRNISYFEMAFTDAAGEATVAGKDSGSAVFAYDPVDGRWELVGISSAIRDAVGLTFTSGPRAGESITISQHTNNISDLGPTTSIAIDISAYLPQIQQISGIPEPASLIALASGLSLLLLRRRVG